MTQDSNTASQQEVNPVEQQNIDTATQQAAPTPEQPKDNRVIKCAMHLTLVDGNQFSTEMLIPASNYSQVRDNVAASLTSQKGEGVLTLTGSIKSQYDWSHICVKSIIMTNMTFLEMLEEREEPVY